MTIEQLVDAYFDAVEARGIAPKTQAKYGADLKKLKTYCRERNLIVARRFSEDDLFRYRRWLADQGYAEKTVEGAIVLAKQAFKWAWRRRILRDYQLAGATFPKARAKPQPCFRSAQVDQLIEAAEGEQKIALALMGYAGLRIGEVEQLRWEDLREENGGWTMIHVRRGGSRGRTKDKDERFVPVHPKVAGLLGPAMRKTGAIFHKTTARNLLKRLKRLCVRCGFDNPCQYKLHSFRHHFASLCANHHVAYRKALAWLGHSSSQMLDLYYHLHDEDSRQAMMALAEAGESREKEVARCSPFEGNLRATGQSRIEKTLQVPEVRELVTCLSDMAERPGFEPGVPFRAHSVSNRAHSAALAPLRCPESIARRAVRQAALWPCQPTGRVARPLGRAAARGAMRPTASVRMPCHPAQDALRAAGLPTRTCLAWRIPCWTRGVVFV